MTGMIGPAKTFQYLKPGHAPGFFVGADGADAYFLNCGTQNALSMRVSGCLGAFWSKVYFPYPYPPSRTYNNNKYIYICMYPLCSQS